MTEIVKVEQEVTFPTYFAATNSEQMAKAQGGLTFWVEGRLSQARMDKMELERARNHAKACKWDYKTLERQLKKAESFEQYYEKMLAALSEGFVMVPAFPIDVFAIRTTQAAPRRDESLAMSGRDTGSASVESERPPIGEGGYVSDGAKRMEAYSHTADHKEYNGTIVKNNFYQFYNQEFQDISFPMIACKPEVMSASVQAMTKKIFDEIGLCVDTSGQTSARARRGDPLIIGAIYGPGPAYSRKKAHFLISWHVNVRDL